MILRDAIYTYSVGPAPGFAGFTLSSIAPTPLALAARPLSGKELLR
jgi:hypothetical protein